MCTRCPRNCAVNRADGEKGVCGQTNELKVARAALHYWEEPCISGKEGSGTVFFSGCSLHCVFCQNEQIANGTVGKIITIERLAEIFLELQQQGANNINLVTPGHFIPQIREALLLSKKQKIFPVPLQFFSKFQHNMQYRRRLLHRKSAQQHQSENDLHYFLL